MKRWKLSAITPNSNLTEVYRQEGRDGDAIKTLRKGFISTGHDVRIQNALEKIGGRRPSILPRLERCHPLNRLLGRLRHRMIGALSYQRCGETKLIDSSYA